ncbi:VOC family protein [Silvibacterium sp.]|uniref:VOC family protein n=1 Tax=Silvibacterium sp. TaxID=1964179 RepID=UPI0039E2CD97
MAFDLRGLCPLVQVYDMPESIRFYCELLGFEIVDHSPLLPSGSFHWAWLRQGEAELMLNTAFEFDDERPAVRDPQWCATHGDTGLFIACPDVDGVYRALKEKGLPLKEPRVAPYGMKQLYLRDPDGYTLCFQWKA